MPSSDGPDRSARRAAILLPSLTSGDATSADAIGITEALREEGWDARLFAGRCPPGTDVGGLPEAARFLESASPVAIYHSGGRWDDGMDLLDRARGPLVVRDHNVTPARFFADVSDEFVDAAERGAEQREALARHPGVVRFLAASSRNATELAGLGAPPERVRVVAPIHRVRELLAGEPDLEALRRWQNRPAALFVGRVAPNKGHRRLLRIAAVYRELYREALPLRLVGAADPRLHRWTSAIELDRDLLALHDSVEFVGAATAGELKAAYLTASVFLCASEHEGFCVPLAEATAFGLPIVAAYEDGVAGTLGPEGLVIRGGDDVIAAAVHRVVDDPALRERLVAAQRARLFTTLSRKAQRASLGDALSGLQ